MKTYTFKHPMGTITMNEKEVEQLFVDLANLENIVLTLINPAQACISWDIPFSTDEEAREKAREYFLRPGSPYSADFINTIFNKLYR